jgi:hypothetical protein
MTKEQEYRNKAAEAVQLASRAATSGDKARLLGVAERWLNLADRVHRSAREHIGNLSLEHPLVRAMMRNFEQA